MEKLLADRLNCLRLQAHYKRTTLAKRAGVTDPLATSLIDKPFDSVGFGKGKCIRCDPSTVIRKYSTGKTVGHPSFQQFLGHDALRAGLKA